MAVGTIIQLRRGSAAEWTSTNPVLHLGEPGIEMDTSKWKVGDGVTAWNSLSYFSGGTGGGATVFTGLGDVPHSYTGQGDMGVRVNGAESGLEFVSRTFNFPFFMSRNGGVLARKIPGYWVSKWNGVIVAWDLEALDGGITVKIWKATGHLPTSADAINTIGITIGSAGQIRSTTLTDFTTLIVSKGDILAANVEGVSGGLTDFAGSIELTKT